MSRGNITRTERGLLYLQQRSKRLPTFMNVQKLTVRERERERESAEVKLLEK